MKINKIENQKLSKCLDCVFTNHCRHATKMERKGKCYVIDWYKIKRRNLSDKK